MTMDDFACQSSDERRKYFEQAASQLNITPQLVEKDFWVCWTLKRLFGLTEFGPHLTFKGGTSLSKVYNVIKRFSEDVDVAIECDSLGFCGDNDPEADVTKKEQQRRVKRLKEACREKIVGELQPALYVAMEAALPTDKTWNLKVDETDREGQTLLFEFPTAVRSKLAYILPSVKIELGARADHIPAEQAEVSPYLCEPFPSALVNKNAMIRVLAAERTFWEKVLILHQLYHLPAEKQFPARMSRHYYDVFQMAEGNIGKRALSKMDLLPRVVAFKSVYFEAPSARYNEACPGSLRLVPQQRVEAELKSDYDSMQTMFFGASPSYVTIIEGLQKLETRINAT
jgi:predicted nucleotidyltransferase component of viral defense system